MLAFHDRTQVVIRLVLVTIGLEDLWTEKGNRGGYRGLGVPGAQAW